MLLISAILATIVLAALVVLLVANFDTLLGADPTSPLRWILPGLVALAAIGGALWATYLQRARPEVYDGIGGIARVPETDEPDLDLPTMPR